VLSGLFGLVRAWPVVFLAVARATWIYVVVLAIGLLVWRSLVWLRTTWSIDDDGLVVRSGILWRSVQTVPPQRVQQVELRQALRHRAVGLAEVRVGLAGGGEANQVDLDALSMEDAELLREVLEQWRLRQHTGTSSATDQHSGAVEVAPVAAGAGRRVFAVETWQLVVGGLTSRSLWLAPLAALAAVLQFLSEARLAEDATDAVRTRLGEISPAITIITIMLAALGVAAVTTVVGNYRLEVMARDDDILVRRGLLEQRSAVVPRRRVQSVEVATNLLREWVGLGSLNIRTADLGGGGDASSTSLPIGRREELEQLVGVLLPSIEFPATLDRHPRPAVRREILRRARRLIPLTMVLALLSAGLDTTVFILAASVGALAAVVTGWIAGRRLRSGWTSTAISTERGAFARRRWVVPVSRVQSVALVTDPFGRRLGLASVRLDLAGSVGGVLLRDLDVRAAHEVVALVESTWSASGHTP
jgi:putative membrane protein